MPADQTQPVGVRPYGDHLDDGQIQVSFTLPLPDGPLARHTALALAAAMGLARADIVDQRQVTDGYTHIIMYGECTHSVDVSRFSTMLAEDAVGWLSEDEVVQVLRHQIRRPVVIVGASTGTDTHTVGIDAILDVKGIHGHSGLEAYRGFQVHNLGSQVPNADLLDTAANLDADVVLVSQTVTQQGLHISNLSELIDQAKLRGLRERTLFICGGPRITGELAKSLGFDAGFGKGTYPNQVASFIVNELMARMPRHTAEPMARS